MTLTFLPPPPQWDLLSPEEKIEHTRREVAVLGHSYSVAAANMGTTRHGVAGAINRAALTDNPIRSSSGLKNQKGVKGTAGGGRTAKTKAAGKARAKAAKPRHAGFHKFIALAIPEIAVDRSAVASSTWAALPGSTPVAIADHVLGCRWPTGDDRPFLYCNDEVQTGVYCPAHAALAYREPPPRKDNGRRDSAR